MRRDNGRTDGAAGTGRPRATRILVISPHPDDESVGCGGTIRKHVLKGDAVHVVFLTSGEAGGHGRSAEETVRLREAEARAAAEILGLASIEFWHEPDGKLRVTPAVVARLRDTIRRLKPQTSKGAYFKKVVLKGTMTPAVQLSVQ